MGEAGISRILIVAADPLLRRLTGDGLQEASFKVVYAYSLGQVEAVLMDRHSIDLLIIDVDFPEEGGIAIAGEARSGNDGLPVLFITNREEDVENSRREIVGRGFSPPFGVMALATARTNLGRRIFTASSQQDGADGLEAGDDRKH